MTEQPTGPTISPVSFLIAHLGFTVNAVQVEGGQWALAGPAMDLVSQLSLHGGPQAQAWRWPTHEDAETAAVDLLSAGAQFVQSIAAIEPAQA